MTLMQRLFPLTLGALSFVAMGCGQSSLKPTAVADVPELLRPFARASCVTLLSIDGTKDNPPKTADDFHGYPVLGRVEIKTANERDEIFKALKSATANQNGNPLLCFWPRHAFRVEKDGHVVDYLICFQCKYLMIFEGEGTESKDYLINQAPRELLDGYFKKHNIPVAP